MRIDQLCALTSIITGEAYDSYSNYNEDIKHNILVLAHDLADDIHWHLHHPDEHKTGGEK